MTDKVLHWLLDESDPDVQGARASAMKKGTIRRILLKQNPFGLSCDMERFYLDKYKGTFGTLLVLSALGADPMDERIRTVFDFILEHSQDRVSGGFSMKMSLRIGEGSRKLSHTVSQCKHDIQSP